MDILDIHTHHPAPQPQGVVSLSATEMARKYASPDMVELFPGQLYSVGIHPWETGTSLTERDFAMLNALARHPQVVAIGEAGVDTLRGGMMYAQLNALCRQIELSEEVCKPLIIHEVKAHDVIIGLYRDLRPQMPWAIHGFRYKPSVAEMFIKLNIYLSFGSQFNPDTLRTVPGELILAETDEDPQTIGQILAAISECTGQEMQQTVQRNVNSFLTHEE